MAQTNAPLSYTVDLTTAAGMKALRVYAKELETENVKASGDAYEALFDVQHERAKAKHRAELERAAKPTLTDASKDGSRSASSSEGQLAKDTEAPKA
jgi:hypothetical protein